MEFTLKDIIYISVYVASVATLFTKMRSSLKELKEGVNSIKKILFKEKGGLNIVDNTRCKEHRDGVHKSIRREAAQTQDALAQIYNLNQNVIRIMMHMNIEPIPMAPKSHESKGFHVEPPA